MGRFNPRAAKSGFAALIKTGSVPTAFIENKGLNMHQVGFGSEHGIDSICPLSTNDLGNMGLT
jgi:hypothetical protein